MANLAVAGEVAAAFIAGYPVGLLVLGSAGMMPAGQPPGRRRYRRRARE